MPCTCSIKHQVIFSLFYFLSKLVFSFLCPFSSWCSFLPQHRAGLHSSISIMHGRNLLLIGKHLSLISTVGFLSVLQKQKNLSSLALKWVETDDVNRKEEAFLTRKAYSEENLGGKFLSLLKACHVPSDLRIGRQIHAQITVNGIDDDVLSTRLLGMYILCRSFLDAKAVFFRLEKASPLPWNWMIRGFTMMGWFESALLFYIKMWYVGALPDKYTFPYVIKSCCSLSAFGLGRLIHGTVSLMGLEADPFVGSSLIKMYTENDSIVEAREVFDRLPERDCVLWNVMIDGYVMNGDTGNAIGLFNSMRRAESEPNYVSFACLLSICAAEPMLSYGTQLHGLTIKYGLHLEASVANTLLAMYSKCRCLVDVHKLFDLMTQADLVSWNSMISGCVQNGLKDEALEFFHQMQATSVKPDSITLASLLPAFSDSTSVKQGKQIHAYILRNGVCMDAFLKSALIDTYFKSKDVEMAQKVFDATGTVDVVICSAMISGYVLNGMSIDALKIFHHLLKAHLKPNAITLSSLLPACSSLAAIRLGKELHGYVLKNAFEGRCYVASALTDMYAKCGRLDLAHVVFTKMSSRDAVAWNSLIASFTQNGQPKEAISLFRQMGAEGMRYDCVTISSALSACASLPALHYGKEIHGFMMKGALRSDLYAESALIDMYAKCGDLKLASRVFDSMHIKNEVSWNNIIAAYGTHGLVKVAASLFQKMHEAGFQPDHITFLSLISACGHAGQVEEGLGFFRHMTEEYGIAARMEHYACIVDLYGRAGKLNKALDFIRSMPIKPDAGIWGALLGACRMHRNVELAELASEQLFEMDPQNSGYYVLLSNIHAATGQWDGFLKVRSLMKEKKVHKVPGFSWIEINKTSHMFYAADKSHPDCAHIYSLLKVLLPELIEEGYNPQPDFVYPQHKESNKRVTT